MSDPLRFRKLWWSVLAATSTLYILTLAPGVVWQDGGEVQFRVLLGEYRDSSAPVRSHVLFYLIAGLFKAVSVGSVAYKANLLSALFGAVTVANVAWLVARLTHSRTSAWTATILFACSHTLWQFSTMAEVMTLATALLSAELCLVSRFFEDRRVCWLWALAFVNGLGVANHNLAMLSSGCYVVLAMLWWRSIPKPVPRTVGPAVLAWAVGAMPWLWLAATELASGSGVAAATRSLFVGRYGDAVFNAARLPVLMAKVAGYLVLNFPTPLILLTPIGWWVARAAVHRKIWIVTSALFFAHFLFAARYDVPDQYSFMVPSYVLMAVFAGIGVSRMRILATSRWRSPLLCLAAALGPGVYAVAPLALARLPAERLPFPSREVPYRNVLVWFLRPWKTGDVGAARFARETLTSLPQDAVLWADSTLATPLLYAQHAEDLRRDVTIDTPLRPPLRLAAPASAPALVAAGRLFVSSDHSAYCPAWIRESYRLARHGLVFRVEMPDTS